ncbi:MAG TPA: hypothetical protein VGE41_00380 [Verrucomicrobiae bacterium]|jgi:hypothetical protein
MKNDGPRLYNPERFCPVLRETFADLKFSHDTYLHVDIPDDLGYPLKPHFPDRSVIKILWGKEARVWKVDSLRSLFRGDKRPPLLGDIPHAYLIELLILETHAMESAYLLHTSRDSQMKEIYSALRRRPDGKSLGVIHDYMWQAAALLLGTNPLSQAEFEAILERLERSCRTFEMGPSSTNYIATLEGTLEPLFLAPDE